LGHRASKGVQDYKVRLVFKAPLVLLEQLERKDLLEFKVSKVLLDQPEQ